MNLYLEIDSDRFSKRLWFSVVFFDKEQKNVAVCTSPEMSIKSGTNKVSLSIPNICFSDGKYFVTLGIMESVVGWSRRDIHGRYENLFSIKISGAPKVAHAPIQLPGNWEAKTI